MKFLTGGTRVLIVLSIAGGLAAVYRLAFGLGAATNLNDAHPWGLWIAADVMAGVALAAGGYCMSAAYYVFGMKKYKPIVRPAILTAFLGYLIVAIGITLDIGKPWAIWHPLVMGQAHSVMFEVAVCVVTYLTVLALEFGPVAAEGLGKDKLRKVLTAITYPLVILGIVLSFMHQSSLGALFLLMKGRLSDLWYTPWLPQMFFLSSIAVGLATVQAESILTARSMKRPPETELLAGLGRGAQIALALYLVVRLGDLLWRGQLGLAFAGDLAGYMFLLEIALVAVPMGLYAGGSRLVASALVIAGVVLNRFDVNFFAQAGARTSYFPAIAEILVTVGLVSFLVLAYRFLVFRLPVLTPAERT
ncbi:MAG: NrfD/PsrC family molybdoenzyme membrane anchor subunit [Myxococcales bacterium]